jgi:transcription elongation factor GreA
MSDSVVMTVESHQALQREIERLEGEGRREIAERIKTAREFGDLKENAEYHDAKNSQSLLETKILTLRDKLMRADVQQSAPPADVVALGTRVTMRDEDSGREDTLTLVPAMDAQLSEGKLSFESPMARALVGASAGSSVKVPTPRGVRHITVLALG